MFRQVDGVVTRAPHPAPVRPLHVITGKAYGMGLAQTGQVTSRR
jgi:hypothetical protein